MQTLYSQTIPCTRFRAKVTYTKSGKKTTKSYKCTVTVKNPGVRLAEATVVVNNKANVVEKVWPASATVTYASSNTEIATVDDKGEVTGVKAGEATITATMECGTKTVEKSTKVTVKKVLLQDAAQTEYNKIKVTILGDTTDLKAGDFKVTNKATNGTVAVKSVDPVRGEADKFNITTFTGMTDAKEYVVTYDGSEASFTATDGTVAKVGVSTVQVPAGVKKTILLTTIDANDIVLGYTPLSNPDSSKGKVTAETTFTKGYIDGSDIYLPSVGDTMTVKVTYHTGTFGIDGKEAGNIEGTFTITAVDPAMINYNYALTIAANPPVWNADSFKANNKIAIGSEKNAYFYITDDNRIDIGAANYSDYSVESADKTKLLVEENKPLVGNQGPIKVRGVSEGNTYILIKKDGNTVASLPVSVLGKPVLTTFELSRYSVNVVKGATDALATEAVYLILKDQYGDPIDAEDVAVTLIGKPKDSSLTIDADASTKVVPHSSKKFVTVSDSTLTETVYGTYIFRITAKNGDKSLTTALSVNRVKETGTSSYDIKVTKPEVDTTIGTGTVTASDSQIGISIAEMVNSGVKAKATVTNVEYTVRNASGTVVAHIGNDKAGASVTNVVTCAAIDVSNQSGVDLTVDTITATPSGAKTQIVKNLPAGTYRVLAVFYENVGAANEKRVEVGGSFTIKDTQDTRVSFKIEKNDFGGKSIAQAFEDPTLVTVHYDGVPQNVTTNGGVLDVDATTLTTANGGAYVRSVTLFVNVSGSNNNVAIRVPINDQVANCAN